MVGLAIDDCIGLIRGAESSIQFKGAFSSSSSFHRFLPLIQDFGQCNNLKERIGDPFWIEHYQSFFLKQAAMAERELGWFFWTWKTGSGSDNDPSLAYWSYSEAIKAKIIPAPLVDEDIKEACYLFESTEPYYVRSLFSIFSHLHLSHLAVLSAERLRRGIKVLVWQ